jgi:hypothetical protein
MQMLMEIQKPENGFSIRFYGFKGQEYLLKVMSVRDSFQTKKLARSDRKLTICEITEEVRISCGSYQAISAETFVNDVSQPQLTIQKKKKTACQ